MTISSVRQHGLLSATVVATTSRIQRKFEVAGAHLFRVFLTGRYHGISVGRNNQFHVHGYFQNCRYATVDYKQVVGYAVNFLRLTVSTVGTYCGNACLDFVGDYGRFGQIHHHVYGNGYGAASATLNVVVLA